MPSMETAYRRQKALLYPVVGIDDFGTPTRSRSGVVELDVRWVDRRSDTVDAEGNTIALDATVVVDREIDIHSVMWKGSLEDAWELVPGTGTGTGTGVVPTEGHYFEVLTYNEAPDLKARAVRRTVGLRRYKAVPPDLAEA